MNLNSTIVINYFNFEEFEDQIMNKKKKRSSDYNLEGSGD